jgi:Arc/MetJ family transcription regulator
MRDEYDFTKGRRGPVVPLAPGKTRITIRIDDDILDWFREQVEQAGGGNYQTLINDTLRQAISAKRESLERVVRRVVREELARGKGPKRGSQR